MAFVEVAGARLEVERIDVGREGASPIVMLHEGLGSVAMWKDFPHRVAHATGRDVVAYSRAGYGRSSPAALPYGVRYMHDEALVVLPKLLDALRIDAPVLLGHSDGASIALIHAASGGRAVAGLVMMAPHVMVESITVKSIAQIAETYERTDLRARLAAYHAHVDDAFLGWSRIWLSPQFQSWSLGADVTALRVPSLAIQGEDDEYGTLAQLDALAVAPVPPQRMVLASCRHSPHRDKETEVLAAIEAFARRLHPDFQSS